MRRLTTFECEGEDLFATLDEGAGTTGLLIVSGGAEIRCGAHRGMAMLARRLSTDGTPVFRYDRRGVGDSGGVRRPTPEAMPDLIAACAAFRRSAPHVRRVVAYGNCDAASALALFHARAGIDALVLANPWLGAEADPLPPAAAIRARYRKSLLAPAQWRRLLSGGIDLGKAVQGLRKIARASVPPAGSDELLEALGGIAVPATIVLAEGDATAIAFAARWHGNPAVPIIRLPTDSHSFARAPDATGLETIVRTALANAEQLVRLQR